MLTVDFQTLALGSGQTLLDVGCGEGRHTLAAYLKSGVLALGVDLGLADLQTARGRIADMEAYAPEGEIDFLQGDATCLPFPDNHFDHVICSEVLEHIPNFIAVIGELNRVLKPGGRALILEFSTPVSAPLQQIYDVYSFSVLPTMGQLVAQDKESYQYLAESIRKHPNQETLAEMMQQAGFETVSYQNLTGGIVAIHSGVKS